MSRQAGKPAGSLKWLVTQYPERPGCFIQLGSILSDPYEVEEALTRTQDIPSLEGEDIKDVSQALSMAITSHLSANAQGRLRAMIPTTIPVNLGGGVGGEAGHEVGRQVEACHVRSNVFRPSPAYMERVLNLPGIIEYLKSSWTTRSLYIIVGVATAQNISVADSFSRTLGGEFELRAEVPGVADGETVLRKDRVAEQDVAYDIPHEVVFAYRVREFQFSRLRKTLKDRGYVTKGTMFGKESNTNDDTDELKIEDYEFEFEEFLDEDSDDEDSDEEALAELID